MPGQDPVLPTCHPSTPPHLSAIDRVTLENTRNSQVYTPPPFTSNACTNSSEEEEGEAELFDQLHDETEDDQPITPDLVRIAVVAGLGGLLFGFDTGVVSGALLSLSHDPSPLSPLTTSQESFLVTSALIGALFASLFAGRLADSDRLGRKGVIIVAGILFSLGAAEMAAAQVYKEIILGRVLVGFGVGLASCVLPTYLAELSPPKYRGRIVASLVVLITGGQALAYITDAIFQSTRQGWRFMFGIGILPALVQLVLSFSLPESPRYLLRKGKHARGRRVVKRLNPGWSNERVQKEVERLLVEVQGSSPNRGDYGGPERIFTSEQSASESKNWAKGVIEGVKGLGKIDWKEKVKGWKREKERYKALVWRDRANRRTLIVACGLQLAQQATGFNCLMYYSTKVIQQTHLSSPATFALVIAISNFLCTLLALRLIDTTGRRKLLLRGLIGMISGMLILSISFGFIPTTTQEQGGKKKVGVAAAVMSLVGMTTFCCFYAVSLGNVPWIVQSEVFVPELKALGTGLSTSVNWAGNIFVSSTFLHISQGLGPSVAFGLFAAICTAAWFFTYFYLPETKGLNLEEVRKLFESEQGPVLRTRRTRGGSGGNEDGDEESGLEGGGGGNGYRFIGDGDEDENEDGDFDDEEGENEVVRTRRKGIV